MTDGPVLVTVDPARTANDAAVPSPTVACAAEAAGTAIDAPRTTAAMGKAATTSADGKRRERAIDDS
jgi:hypothetical protein